MELSVANREICDLSAPLEKGDDGRPLLGRLRRRHRMIAKIKSNNSTRPPIPPARAPINTLRGMKCDVCESEAGASVVAAVGTAEPVVLVAGAEGEGCAGGSSDAFAAFAGVIMK